MLRFAETETVEGPKGPKNLQNATFWNGASQGFMWKKEPKGMKREKLRVTFFLIKSNYPLNDH